MKQCQRCGKIHPVEEKCADEKFQVIVIPSVVQTLIIPTLILLVYYLGFFALPFIHLHSDVLVYHMGTTNQLSALLLEMSHLYQNRGLFVLYLLFIFVPVIYFATSFGNQLWLRLLQFLATSVFVGMIWYVSTNLVQIIFDWITIIPDSYVDFNYGFYFIVFSAMAMITHACFNLICLMKRENQVSR